MTFRRKCFLTAGAALLLLITAWVIADHRTEIKMRQYLRSHKEDFAAIENSFEQVSGAHPNTKITCSEGYFTVGLTERVPLNADTRLALKNITQEFGLVADWAFVNEKNGGFYVKAAQKDVPNDRERIRTFYFCCIDGEWGVDSRVQFWG